MATFTARYHGECGECGHHISPGDEVQYDRTDTLVHATCPERPDDAPAGSPCPKCWTYHAGDCL